jgi:NADH-quinone oxidoreductase subunit H
MISYELPLGLALSGPLLLAGSLKLSDVVNAQIHSLWFILPQFLAFFIYLTSAVAETNRAPFDLPEAEQELIAGYHTEYSSFRFAMFFMGEYVAMVIVSAVAVTFFFGGWHGPFPNVAWLGAVWFLIKMLAVLYFYIWVRGTWPRVRYDQLMRLGWKLNIPAALINLLITALILALFPHPTGRPWPGITAAIILTVVSLILGAVLYFIVSASLKSSVNYVARRGQRGTGGISFDVLTGRREE